MTEPERKEIERRARQDAKAHQSGWPAQCPYFSAERATLWKTTFDLALNELKAGKQ